MNVNLIKIYQDDMYVDVFKLHIILKHGLCFLTGAHPPTTVYQPILVHGTKFAMLQPMIKVYEK